MPPWANLVAFAIASAILIAIPGPSMLFVVGRSLSLGRRGGLLSVLGNTLGLVPHLVAVAAGVGALVAASEAGLLALIKIIGAGYLIYLGAQAIRHRAHPDPVSARSPYGTGTSSRRASRSASATRRRSSSSPRCCPSSSRTTGPRSGRSCWCSVHCSRSSPWSVIPSGCHRQRGPLARGPITSTAGPDPRSGRRHDDRSRRWPRGQRPAARLTPTSAGQRR